jgi:hypothetical protein
MDTVTLEQVIHLADQLSDSERNALLQHLQSTIVSARPRVTRELLLAELEQLRAAGAFNNVESLRNKYANPEITLSDEELLASIREFASEWEQDIDDLFASADD